MSYGVELIWDSQTADKQRFVKVRIDEIPAVQCFVATNGITGNRSLLIDFSGETVLPEFRIQRFRGVEIQILPLMDQRELAVILMENSLAGVVCLLTEDILKEIAECATATDAITATFRVISSWKRMFENLNLNGLSGEQQKGLFGELYFMQRLAEQNIDYQLVLDSWNGPDALNQDYVINGIGVEVKTTAANHPLVQVSNELQLSAQNLSNLFIYLVVIDERKGRLLTLNTLVSDLRQIFESSTELTDMFNDKLLKAGYQDDHFQQYENREYHVRDLKTYKVTEGFPCITLGIIPEGVHHVTYQIDTSACANFTIAVEELFVEISH